MGCICTYLIEMTNVKFYVRKFSGSCCSPYCYHELLWSLFYAVRYCLFLTDTYFVSNGSSFLSIQNETRSSPILSCFGVLHPKKDCLPTIKVKHIDNVASLWFLFASCETAATLEIKFLYSLSFVRFFLFFSLYSIFGFYENASILLM